jgi:hypothetical protein
MTIFLRAEIWSGLIWRESIEIWIIIVCVQIRDKIILGLDTLDPRSYYKRGKMLFFGCFHGLRTGTGNEITLFSFTP